MIMLGAIFALIFRDFAQIFRDFPGFSTNQNFWGWHLLYPHLLHHWLVCCTYNTKIKTTNVFIFQKIIIKGDFGNKIFA